MGFFKTLFGGGGSKGAGGTADAFAQFQKFSESIQNTVNNRQANLLNQGSNPFLSDFRSPFETAIGQNEALGAQIQGTDFGGLAQSSALANTQGAQSDALRAARLAAGGRGGLGFGGGAQALAGRAAQQASSQQGAALSNALLQGQQAKFGLLQQNAQLGGQLAQGLTSSISGQASLEEVARARGDALQNINIQGQFGLGGASLGVGLQGNQARRQNQIAGAGNIFAAGASLLGGII